MGEKFVILGWDRKTGEYQGQPYDNIVFYVEPEAKKAAQGIVTEQIKMKTAIIDISGIHLDASTVGKELVVAWDRYGKAAAVEICEF